MIGSLPWISTAVSDCKGSFVLSISVDSFSGNDFSVIIRVQLGPITLIFLTEAF